MTLDVYADLFDEDLALPSASTPLSDLLRNDCGLAADWLILMRHLEPKTAGQ